MTGSAGGLTGWWDRLVFRVYGPAQLGAQEADRPDRPAADPACADCGLPESAHEVVRASHATYLRCPPEA